MHFFCLSMQEKLPVAGPFNTKNAEYGDFEQKTIYSFITVSYTHLVDKILQKSWQNLAKLGIISQFERRNYENSSAFRVPRQHLPLNHGRIRNERSSKELSLIHI